MEYATEKEKLDEEVVQDGQSKSCPSQLLKLISLSDLKRCSDIS